MHRNILHEDLTYPPLRTIQNSGFQRRALKLSTAKYLRKLAVAKFDMTTVPTVTMTPNSDTKAESDENIVIRGKFKSVDLFNKTIHIILYPHDGLRAAVRLQEIEEGTDIVLDLTKHENF